MLVNNAPFAHPFYFVYVCSIKNVQHSCTVWEVTDQCLIRAPHTRLAASVTDKRAGADVTEHAVVCMQSQITHFFTSLTHVNLITVLQTCSTFHLLWRLKILSKQHWTALTFIILMINRHFSKYLVLCSTDERKSHTLKKLCHFHSDIASKFH